MADNPDIKWALDALTPEPDYKRPLLAQYSLTVLTPVAIFTGILMQNQLSGRPILSGIHRNIVTSAIGCMCAYAIQKMYDGYYAQRDQYIRHYVMLHPEDFPEPKRKKWSEVLQPWAPSR